jgi:hypothetical protein
MGDNAVILEGADSPRSAESLYSTVHGAGRLFSRTQAKKTFDRATMDAWLRQRDILLRGADLDESPMAYRRLVEVLAEHDGTFPHPSRSAAGGGHDGRAQRARSLQGLKRGSSRLSRVSTRAARPSASKGARTFTSLSKNT